MDGSDAGKALSECFTETFDNIVKDSKIELRGAKLALDEAISKLRKSVHPMGCEEGEHGDDANGVNLASRIQGHKSKIDDALVYWEKAIQNYKHVKYDVDNRG